MRKRFEEAGVLRHSQQFLVRDDDGRVHRFHQFGDAALRLLHAAFAFEGERLGDHRDGKRAHFARQRGDDRRSPRARASAKSGGDENHVRAFQRFNDFVGVFERSLAADFRIRARAEAIRQLHAELNLGGRARHAQRLQVGVGHDELDVLHARVDHAIDGVVAPAAHADDLDARVVVELPR